MIELIGKSWKTAVINLVDAKPKATKLIWQNADHSGKHKFASDDSIKLYSGQKDTITFIEWKKKHNKQ